MASALTLTSTTRLSSGHPIPLLGFGVYQSVKTKESVLEAFRAGYRHVDSAQVYYNEAEVGEAVRLSGLKREEVFITTKVRGENAGYEKTLKSVDESLKKMKFDYVDLFLIHDPLAGKELRLETYKALLECKAAGKIKSIGVSNFGIRHLEELKEAGLEVPSVNQIELHPLCQQRPIAKYCQDNGILVEAYCPILQGSLGNPLFAEIGKKHDREPAQILLRWSLQKGYSPLPKSETPSRIQSNAKLYDFELDGDDMEKLDALDKGADGAVSWNPVDAA